MKDRFSNKTLLPFFVIVTVLVVLLFITLFLTGNSALSRDTGYESGDLELNEVLVKILLKQGESLEKSIQITNRESTSETIFVVIENLEGILALEESEFFLRPGETKNLDLSFITGTDSFSFESGVYIGNLKFQYGAEEVVLPVVVEIESEDVLFDMNLDFSVNDRVVLVGGTALADVMVYNFGDLDQATVDMTYVVSNTDNVRLLSEEDNIVVQTQALVTKTISIPENFDEGKYVFYVLAEYGDSVGTASYIFDVAEEEPGSAINLGSICSPSDPLCWVSFIILIILIFFVGAYAYFYLGSFLYRGVNSDGVEKSKKMPLLYFFVGLIVVVFLIILFYLSSVMDGGGVAGYFSNVPGWFLWTVLVILIIIAFIVILNFLFGVLKNRKSPEDKEFVVQSRKEQKEEVKFRRQLQIAKVKRPSVFAGLFAKKEKKLVKKEKLPPMPKFKAPKEKKGGLFFKKPKEQLKPFVMKKKIKKKGRKPKLTFERLFFKKPTRKQEIQKKPSFLARWSKSAEEKKKEKEKEKKRILLEKKKEQKELKKQELQQKKLIEKERRKAELEEKKWKKEQEKMIREAHKLETVFKAKKVKAKKEDVKVIMPQKIVPVVLDPVKKMNQLIRGCDKHILNGNFGMADSCYEQTKPVYSKLTDEERRKYDVLLTELQNRLAMLQMSEFKKSLMPKRKH
jgi:hypothetical protein